jgi:hypothetical protein
MSPSDHRLIVASLSLALACAPAVLAPVDPEREARVAALGPEDPRVPEGPLHRPGQPCALCHDGRDEAAAFTVAGTVYRDIASSVPLVDGDVALVDSAGNRFTSRTNCVGNFYTSKYQFNPVLPFWVTVRLGANESPMESPIHREASCATCHFDPAAPTTAGHVYLTADDLVAPTIPTRACRPDEALF